MLRSALFHVLWAALSYWTFSPFWYMSAGRMTHAEGYGVYLPAAILAAAVLQWWALGRERVLPLRAAPWALLFLVFVIVNWPEAAWFGLAGAGLMVILNLMGTALCLADLVRRPEY